MPACRVLLVQPFLIFLKLRGCRREECCAELRLQRLDLGDCVAVLAERKPIEVQFDEHKLFHVYAPNLKPFRRVLRAQGVPRRAVLPLISEAEHLHHTTAAFCDDFRQFAVRTGVGDFDRVFSDEL